MPPIFNAFSPFQTMTPLGFEAQAMEFTPGIMSVTNGHDTGGGGGGSAIVPSSPNLLALAPQTGLAVLTKPPLLLTTMMPDDSGSISSGGNAPAIRRGHNDQIENAKGHPNMLLRTRYLNGYELFGFRKPEEAVAMDEHNYNPNQGTPLYDQTFLVLEEVLQSAALYMDKFDVYTMTCIMTDGHDEGSKSKRADDVRELVERMIKTERHIIAGMAVSDGYTNFNQVFRSMGIPEQWIMVLKRDEKDIVEGMSQFSKATRTVVGNASFQHTSRVGFTQQYGSPASVAATGGNHGQAGTAQAGANTIGAMMGAVPRSPIEEGKVDPQQLPWEPPQVAYALNRDTGGWDPVASPFAWDASRGLYCLTLPEPNTAIFLGRDQGSADEESRRRMKEILKPLLENNPELRLLRIRLRDKRQVSPVSRSHALILSLGENVFSIRGLDGHVGVLPTDDPAEDRFLQAGRDESTFLDDDNRVKLTPEVVFLVRRRA